MKFYGTRDPQKIYSLSEAAMTGLAPCGGLYMPCRIPKIDMKIVLEKAEQSFSEMSLYLCQQFFAEDLDTSTLRQITEQAFDFPVTLAPTGALELFHGPTLAFKDFGARFMGQMISRLRTREITILTATSGDTGSAVANGFYDMPGVRVIILYPKGRVSDFQERQMTTLGHNITALRVDGSFDDCQRMVKEIFADHQFCHDRGITSANSISILRWIPQSFYYFYGYYLWLKQGGTGEVTVVVPSGNFGNITAGMMAKQMGLPIKHFIAATNANDTIPQFLQSGTYQAKESVETISNAMDVGNPSNYERLMALYGGDMKALKDELTAVSFTDDQTIEAMRELYDKFGYVSDPHSAVGYLAFKSHGNGFYLSTAHPVKFESVIKEALNLELPYPERVSKFFESDKQFSDIDSNTESLKGLLLTL